MKVLIACEYSGTVREAFKALGHDAWSCDILPTDIPGQHIQDDIFHVLCGSTTWCWDLIIAHPPCTYICNSGVRWLWNKDGSKNTERWKQMERGQNFLKHFYILIATRLLLRIQFLTSMLLRSLERNIVK